MNTLESGQSMERIAGAENEPVREKVMEGAKLERLRLLADAAGNGLKRLSAERAVQKALNLLPFLGDAIMGIKAVKGTEGERRLSLRERAFYGAAAITAFASYIYVNQGRYKEAFTAYALAEFFSKADAIPAIVSEVSQKVARSNPEFARMLAEIADLIEDGKEAMRDLPQVWDQSIIKLNLQGQEITE